MCIKLFLQRHLYIVMMSSVVLVTSNIKLFVCEEELKHLLMKLKEESEKVGLKPNIRKTKIMASSPITSWQIDGETMVNDRLYFGGLQNHCRW